MSSHRRDVRPRYARIAALATSVSVTAVAALAGLGVLTTSPAPAGASARPAAYEHAKPAADHPVSTPTPTSVPAGSVAAPQGTTNSAEGALTRGVPSDSGHGRRIVFSEHLQRVWLVGGHGVRRSYLVSGSTYDNLHPGTYSVYSKSRWAVGVEDSGVMQYFVRFTQGPTGAAIGFHSIPTHDGTPLQSRAQLGTPQSHGCIRQDLPDAIALWKFAPVGTKVVVVA
jgi:lipoprotein-anchoring transpeptidase ErfK/SrfK